MRRWLFCVIVALAACSHTGSSGPAWPKDRARDDGGESIAPRETSKAVAVALEQDSDDDDAKPADKPADQPAAKPAPPPAATPAASATPASEEPIQTEEIVIEVGPDD